MSIVRYLLSYARHVSKIRDFLVTGQVPNLDTKLAAGDRGWLFIFLPSIAKSQVQYA